MTTIVVVFIIGALSGLSAMLLFSSTIRWRRQRSWSPFGFDGKLRIDLFAAHFIDGKWHPNPQANDGFYQLGAMTDDSIQRADIDEARDYGGRQ